MIVELENDGQAFVEAVEVDTLAALRVPCVLSAGWAVGGQFDHR